MRAALVIILLCSLGLVIEGALISVVPAILLPDMALLGTLAAALFLGGAPALLVLAGLGFASDLLGGAPLGLHVLSFLIPFAAARAANGSLELRRGVPEAVLVGVLTPVAGASVAGLLELAGVSAGFGLAFWLGLAVHTAVNALAAPAVCALVEAIAASMGDLDPTRRGVAYLGSATWTALRRHG